MEKNKTGKYLKYAIGEIILVVIGILIALSINNWNERQKSIKNENELITSLKKEITNNIIELESSVEKNKRFLEANEKLIKSLKQKDELFSAIELDNALNYRPYEVDSPVLDRIIATNSNILIENNEQLAGFRLLKKSYSKVAKDLYYIDEFWNNKVTNFIIANGTWIENKDNDFQISLKEIAHDGYSKKQFITILKIQHVLHKSWKYGMVNATEKSKVILDSLNKQKTKG